MLNNIYMMGEQGQKTELLNCRAIKKQRKLINITTSGSQKNNQSVRKQK